MSDAHNLTELAPLIERMLEDSASEGEWQQLAEMLMASEEARRYYARYIQMRSLLMQGAHVGIPRVSTPDPNHDLTETMILPAIRREEEAKPVEVGPDFPILPPPPMPASWQRRQIWRFSIAAAVVVGLLILGAILGRPPSPAPAVLVAEVDAQWGPPGTAFHPGDPIRGPLELVSGQAQIQLRSGASIVLDGPTNVQVRSDNAAELTLGKLTATVPPEATGFTVRAGSARIVDRGTEFGVEVKADSTVAVDVLRGKVEAQPNDAVAPTVLVAGQVATVTATAVTIQPPETHREFTQVLSAENSLDVCDLLCGGDGTTHQRGHSIEIGTGEAGVLAASEYTYGDYAYHAVPTLAVVDGCFIPDGRNGPQQVDSAGHRYQFDATMNRSFNRLWVGGKVPKPGPVYHDTPSALGGIDYSVLPHGFLAMHSNKGLTLNLDAVRRLQPGKRLLAFRCIAGNSSPIAGVGVNLTVLFDGALAFPPRTLVSKDVPVGITVPIQADNHFMTITSTQNEKKMGDNFMLLGDPMFDFKSP